MSLLITTLIYYLPILGLWRTLLEQRIKLDISMFGMAFRINVPSTGILLLIFWSFVTWGVLTLVLLGLEKLLKVDLLEKLKLRNGLLYADLPVVTTQVLTYLAYFTVGWLVVKYVFLALFQLLGSWGLLDWLGRLTPLGGQSSGLSFTRILLSFLSAPLEMAGLAFSLLVIVVSAFARKEAKSRYLADIEKSQEIRHRQTRVVVFPSTKIE